MLGLLWYRGIDRRWERHRNDQSLSVIHRHLPFTFAPLGIGFIVAGVGAVAVAAGGRLVFLGLLTLALPLSVGLGPLVLVPLGIAAGVAR